MKGASTLASVGARVWVPFRKQIKLGVVIGKEMVAPGKNPLKSVEGVIDEHALISPDLLALCIWIGNYYQSPLSEVFASAVAPKKYRLGLLANYL